MIQRIQTVYFFLGAIALFVYAFMCDFNLLNIATKITEVFLPAMASVVVAFFSLIIIFLFKNRKIQTRISSFLILIVIAIIAFFIYNFGVKLFYQEWTFYLLPVSIFFLFLGRKNVVADEELIKSSDRLR